MRKTPPSAPRSMCFRYVRRRLILLSVTCDTHTARLMNSALAVLNRIYALPTSSPAFTTVLFHAGSYHTFAHCTRACHHLEEVYIWKFDAIKCCFSAKPALGIMGYWLLCTAIAEHWNGRVSGTIKSCEADIRYSGLMVGCCWYVLRIAVRKAVKQRLLTESRRLHEDPSAKQVLGVF